jgi:POT family proton-dependent oligopeptide transporter
MDSRKAQIVVAGHGYDFGPADGGGLQIKALPAAAPLPAVLAKDTYTMKTARDPRGVAGFYLAVSLIIMGVGFLKPNISTIVGQLYPQGDPRRDAGFTLYYYGVNLGAFWASILCALLGQTVGWWAGFGLAGVGMSLGFVVFVLLGRRYFEGKGEPPNPELLARPLLGPISREWLIYLGGLLGVGVVWLLVPRNDLVGNALAVAIVIALLAIAYIIVRVCKTWAQRQRMMLAVVLTFGAVVFFTLFEQAGTSLNLFASTNVDMAITHSASTFLGIPIGTADQLKAAGIVNPSFWIDTKIGAAQTQSFNAGFILLLAPLFAATWAYLAQRGRDPNPTLKFGFGLLQVGLGFMVIVWGAGMADATWRLPLMMLGLLYFLHTTGELCLSPVGLSEITKLSLPAVVSFMMSVWFLSSAIAGLVGGRIAALMGTETVGGQVLDPKAALMTSLHGFNLLGWSGIACGVVFIALSFAIKGWAHGVNDPANHPAAEPAAAEGRA